ncbi:MAG: RidA family protein [Alphaproteobacteria bacterium]|nr:RidA family protein [Alphaproteobacteria bacterium]
MRMRRVTSEHVNEPPPETWSNCKVVGDFVYIAGLTAGPRTGEVAGGDDMYEQSRIIFEKISHLMTAAGGKTNDIAKVTIFVTDITRREEVWRARAEHFTGDFPCSTLVEVAALAVPGLLVEVEAVGILGAGAE